MGSDYFISACEKKDGKLVRVEDVPPAPQHFLKQYRELHKILDRRGEWTPQIMKQMNHDVDYHFFEVINRPEKDIPEELGEDPCFPPGEVLDTLQSTLSVLKNSQDEFPPHYLVKVKNNDTGEYLIRRRVVVDGRKGRIRDGWSRCLIEFPRNPLVFWRDNDTIDLTGKKKFACESPEGETVVIEIEETTMYEYFKPMLEEMIELCKYAQKHGYCIKPTLSI